MTITPLKNGMNYQNQKKKDVLIIVFNIFFNNNILYNKVLYGEV